MKGIAIVALSLLLAACQSTPQKPLPLAAHVDLDRFMGDWYVIAATPTLIDREAHDAIESYRRDRDGSIATRYTFRDGGFDGPQRSYHPRGFVRDTASNAVWGMQFLWPFKSDYRISFLASDYSRVVIARQERDYAWIMAREPQLDEARLQEMIAFLAAQGYDPTSLRRIPHRATGATR